VCRLARKRCFCFKHDSPNVLMKSVTDAILGGIAGLRGSGQAQPPRNQTSSTRSQELTFALTQGNSHGPRLRLDLQLAMCLARQHSRDSRSAGSLKRTLSQPPPTFWPSHFRSCTLRLECVSNVGFQPVWPITVQSRDFMVKPHDDLKVVVCETSCGQWSPGNLTPCFVFLLRSIIVEASPRSEAFR
jgi:hypothetical protein